MLDNPVQTPTICSILTEAKVTCTPMHDGLRFGNFVKGSIHGFKFDDYDKNGLYDPSITHGPDGKHDTPLAGIPFELTGDVDNDGNVDSILTFTDHNGEFWFEEIELPSGDVVPGLWPGEYTVTERLDLIHPDYTASPPLHID